MRPDEKGFVIRVRSNVPSRILISLIIHELEHYDIAKRLMKMKIPQQKPIYKNGKCVLYRELYPEWTHSNPSYDPSNIFKVSLSAIHRLELSV